MFRDKNLFMASMHAKWKLNSYGSYKCYGDQKNPTKKHISESVLKSEDFLSRQNETEFHLNPNSKDFKKLDFCRKYLAKGIEVVDVSAAPGLLGLVSPGRTSTWRSSARGPPPPAAS